MRAVTPSRRPLRTALVTSLIGAAALALAFAAAGLIGSGHQERSGEAVSGGVLPSPILDEPTNFRMATFNVLGASHTAPGGNHASWADGVTRMTWAVQLINENALDFVGFQELQRPQFDRFKQLEGARWGIYPGLQLTRMSMQNSLAWRKDTWQLIEAHTIPIPYFHGTIVRMPYVLLQNKATGRLAWFYNSHNPANTHGPAQKYRDEGYRREIALVNQLRLAMPDAPVFITGDKNDRSDYFCPVVLGTDLEAANGGGDEDGACRPPADIGIDWLMGSEEVAFTNYVALESALERKTSDHPLVMSGVTVPPRSVVESPIDHVVVVNLEGLTTRAIARWGDDDGLLLARLLETGASTLNARTAYERTGNLTNLTGLLSGRRVNPDVGGHGVGWQTDPGTTVAAAAGEYVSSIFDLAHNFGLGTALLTSDPEQARLDLSWDAVNGGADPHGDDNGTDKIDTFVVDESDSSLVAQLADLLAGDAPELTVLNLSELNEAGLTYGFFSSEYRDAVGQADHQVRRVRRAIAASPETAGRTLLVITSGHGGSQHAFVPASLLANARVPIIVKGPGVARGVDLYTLNPQYADPGTTVPGYRGPQPIRLADLADLITRVLGLPHIPGVTTNYDQSMVVTPPYEPPAARK